MKPIRLRMRAFGSYGKDTMIDFTKTSQNLFLITGDTGSGKSTIFDAIVFALYGQASSSNDKKEGFDLQSQYAGYDVEPYVELEFSEMRGGEELSFRVRRQPQYKRNKRGGGTVDEKEQVEIFRPDGTRSVSAVNQKQKDKNEINQEIVNIIGLTKEQFMQVAMIAQGDFTRLIKAPTSERKPIFRKIFNTGIYEKIIESLKNRYTELSRKNAIIKSGIKMDVARISIPEDYQEHSVAEECKQKIIKDDKWTTVDMEDLLSMLNDLCEYLSSLTETAKKKREDAETQRNNARDKLTEAETLVNSFIQLEAAQLILEECAKRKEEMAQMEKLEGDIQKAYKIKEVYDLLAKAKVKLNEYKEELKELKEQLPEQIENETKAENEKNRLNADYMEKKDDFARIEEAVKKALDLFGKIKEAEEEEKKCQEDEQACLEEKIKAAEKLTDFNRQLEEWKNEQKQLSDSGVLLEKVSNELDRIKDAEKDRKAAETAESEREKQKGKAEQAQKAYEEARQQFDEQNSVFLKERSAFLDAQAGLLASKLKDGEPCPVCGSLSHPAPRKLTEEHRELTQEYIDKKEQEISQLDGKQRELSEKASIANTELAAKEDQLREKIEYLMNSLGLVEAEFTEPLDLKQIKIVLDARVQKTEDKKAALVKDEERYKELSKLIENSAEERMKLSDQLAETSKKYDEAHDKYTRAKTTREETEKQKTYATEQEANEKLLQAESTCRDAEEMYKSAEGDYDTAKSEREKTETKIKTLREKTIPAQQKETEECQNNYEEAVEQAAMSESEWLDLVELHKKEELTDIKKALEEYKKKKNSAEGQKSAAKAAVGDKSKPDVETLKSTKGLLENAYNEADEYYQDICKKSENNSGIYKDLTSKFSEQKEQLLEFNRVIYLREKLAGKDTGDKMDIETMVQRIYLERILDAANRRFLEMSSDQFEFRMMDISKSSGKDRGLELMVRSTVTGKEQEVKMLSGGESFIAALSLALGISDQIQQNSAFVNLDMMFIDEGFGSLDGNTRNQAIRVLKKMADGSKMIGIISHVSELQQQIDDKLVVKRDHSGSSAHWVVS